MDPLQVARERLAVTRAALKAAAFDTPEWAAAMNAHSVAVREHAEARRLKVDDARAEDLRRRALDIAASAVRHSCEAPTIWNGS